MNQHDIEMFILSKASFSNPQDLEFTFRSSDITYIAIKLSEELNHAYYMAEEMKQIAETRHFQKVQLAISLQEKVKELKKLTSRIIELEKENNK